MQQVFLVFFLSIDCYLLLAQANSSRLYLHRTPQIVFTVSQISFRSTSPSLFNDRWSWFGFCRLRSTLERIYELVHTSSDHLQSSDCLDLSVPSLDLSGTLFSFIASETRSTVNDSFYHTSIAGRSVAFDHRECLSITGIRRLYNWRDQRTVVLHSTDIESDWSLTIGHLCVFTCCSSMEE